MSPYALSASALLNLLVFSPEAMRKKCFRKGSSSAGLAAAGFHWRGCFPSEHRLTEPVGGAGRGPPLQGPRAPALSAHSGQALGLRLHIQHLFYCHNTPTIHTTNVETEAQLKNKKRRPSLHPSLDSNPFAKWLCSCSPRRAVCISPAPERCGHSPAGSGVLPQPLGPPSPSGDQACQGRMTLWCPSPWVMVIPQKQGL